MFLRGILLLAVRVVSRSLKREALVLLLYESREGAVFYRGLRVNFSLLSHLARAGCEEIFPRRLYVVHPRYAESTT